MRARGADVLAQIGRTVEHRSNNFPDESFAVLQDAGYRVRVPRERLCCGRSLYDFGVLDEAKRYLRTVLHALTPDIEKGTPVVCLEPSCASVFHDELRNLFPDDKFALKLSQLVILLPDLLLRAGYRPPRLRLQQPESRKQAEPNGLKAIVHGHCHHKALWNMNSEKALLDNAGFQAELLDSGCCGLAGSFGYEREHHDISMQIGERVLLPAVRHADPETVIVADGFSCRQQIAHGTNRTAMHTAEVLQMALESQEKPLPLPGKRRFIESGKVQSKTGPIGIVTLLGLGLVGFAGYLLTRNGKLDKNGQITGDR
jgi:Fe-S oxidoreductase